MPLNLLIKLVNALSLLWASALLYLGLVSSRLASSNLPLTEEQLPYIAPIPNLHRWESIFRPWSGLSEQLLLSLVGLLTRLPERRKPTKDLLLRRKPIFFFCLTHAFWDPFQFHKQVQRKPRVRGVRSLAQGQKKPHYARKFSQESPSSHSAVTMLRKSLLFQGAKARSYCKGEMEGDLGAKNIARRSYRERRRCQRLNE